MQVLNRHFDLEKFTYKRYMLMSMSNVNVYKCINQQQIKLKVYIVGLNPNI